MKNKKTIIALAVLIIFSGIVFSMRKPPADVSGMMGKWFGPEGTYLEVQQTGESYLVTIQNLDSTAYYPSKVTSKGISFTRDNVRETIKHGTGADTGMKWLADKKDCLIVKTGEGYCR
jgi:hypothetical protein